MKDKDKNIKMSKTGGFMIIWNNEDNVSQIKFTCSGSTKWFKKEIKKCQKKDKKNQWKEGFYTDEKNKSKVELFLCETIHPLVWGVLRSEECDHTSMTYDLIDHNNNSMEWMGQLSLVNQKQLDELDKLGDSSLDEVSKVLSDMNVGETI